VQNFVAQQPHVTFRQLKVLSSQTNEELPYEAVLSAVLDRQLIVVEEEGELFSQCSNSKKSPQTLMDCLSDYLAPELLDDPWYCNGTCQRVANAVKRLELTVVPPVLVLQLERFTNVNGIRRKLEILVDYPIDELNLNGLLNNGNRKAIYDLVAVTNHSGSIHGGHYVACARQIGTDSWYRFSDSFVSLAQSSDIVSSDAYLLFYVQRFVKETAC
jgi:ubiquitin C-terminal hydrolase